MGLLLVPCLAVLALGDALTPSEATEAPAAGAADATDSVLAHPRIRLSTPARSDIEGGRADPRLLAVLLTLSERHDLGWVGPIATGHSYFVAGTRRVSNHVLGRAVDISVIDRSPVSSSNLGALEAVREVLSLPAGLRPTDVGAPWRLEIGAARSWTDEMHRDHLHLGWDSY